jgi:hypothetical protein
LEEPLLLHAAAVRATAGTVSAATIGRARERSLTSDSLVLWRDWWVSPSLFRTG